jgi:hypothetical protein
MMRKGSTWGLLALIMVISQIQIPVAETESVVLDNPFVISTNYTVGMTGSTPTPAPTEEPTSEPECHPSYEGAYLGW